MMIVLLPLYSSSDKISESESGLLAVYAQVLTRNLSPADSVSLVTHKVRKTETTMHKNTSKIQKQSWDAGKKETRTKNRKY